jgi:hypothetical protein
VALADGGDLALGEEALRDDVGPLPRVRALQYLHGRADVGEVVLGLGDGGLVLGDGAEDFGALTGEGL